MRGGVDGRRAKRAGGDVTEDELDSYLNLNGTHLTTQAAVRQTKKPGGGCIVNVGTVLVALTTSLAAS